MKSDKDVTKIKRVTFFSETVYFLYYEIFILTFYFHLAVYTMISCYSQIHKNRNDVPNKSACDQI